MHGGDAEIEARLSEYIVCALAGCEQPCVPLFAILQVGCGVHVFTRIYSCHLCSFHDYDGGLLEEIVYAHRRHFWSRVRSIGGGLCK